VDSWSKVVSGHVDSKHYHAFHCLIAHASSGYRLLDPSHFLLPLLGARFPLEVAVGVNGRVWVNCKEAKHTIAVIRCIEGVDERKMEAQDVKAFLGTLDV